MRLKETLHSKKSRHFRSSTQQIIPESSTHFNITEEEEEESHSKIENDIKNSNISVYRSRANVKKGRIFLGKTMMVIPGIMSNYGQLDTI